MDVSHILTETQRAAGFWLTEDTSGLRKLRQRGKSHEVDVFGQGISDEAIRLVVQCLMTRRQPCQA